MSEIKRTGTDYTEAIGTLAENLNLVRDERFMAYRYEELSNEQILTLATLNLLSEAKNLYKIRNHLYKIRKHLLFYTILLSLGLASGFIFMISFIA